MHKIHHGPDLGEATTFTRIVYSVPGHGTRTQMSFCPETPKWKSQNSQSLDFRNFRGPIPLCIDLRLRWGLKQSCILRQELSKDMSHTTYTQGNWDDSRLLVVRSQIGNLTPDPSFSHNLCFKCPNGSCEPILDIYVPRACKWYK
jgi:hypothetical protein